MPQAQAPVTSQSSAYLSALTSEIEKKLQRVGPRSSCFEIPLMIFPLVAEKMYESIKEVGVLN